MADNLKSLVIISSTIQPGKNAPWSPIVEPENFSKGIAIPDISQEGENKVDIGSLVSGMPTVFARANMFANAIKNDSKEDVKGLMFFYATLISEWKGLISCIALDYKNFKVDRISLGYSDNKSIGETINPYQVTGAFGNALFDRKELWCDQKVAKDDQVPFIDVLRYSENGDNQVVGGTSPDSLLFTSSSYELKGSAAYINKGKFINPFSDNKSDVSESDLLKIYGYALHLKKNLEEYRIYFSELKDKSLEGSLITSKIDQCLQAWILEMNEYQVLKGYKKLNIETKPPEVGSKFLSPFGLIFNFSTELYGSEGIISDVKTDDGILFDPNDLLLPDTTEIAQIRFERGSDKNPNCLSEKPILVLKAEYTKEKDRFAYFTLPISPLALNVFGKNLDAFVGLNENSGVKSRISALYESTTDGEILTVSLQLFTNTGQIIDKSIKYKVGKEIKGKDILMWPNFISKQWNRYFLYSEMPHNDPQFQANPFVGNVDDDFFRIIFNKKGAPLLLAENSKASDLTDENKDVNVKLHLNFNNAVANSDYHYEIYESDQPFKGIKFSYAGADCGYVIIRYDEFNAKNDLPKNKLKTNIDFAKAYLGIDFGSTNTSVAYYSKTHQEMMGTMKFKNRRISLLGNDNKNNDEYAAVEDEVFFFQNEEIRSNSIKSMLTIHDPKRVVKDNEQQSEISALGMAIKGGFPNFEKNLPIESASENRYKLNFARAGYAEIVHNMKWNTLDVEIAYKKAYLSSLLLHVYAHLFDEGHEPVKLKWSYPSSMGGILVGKYSDIWQTLPVVNPIKGGVDLDVAKGPLASQNTDPDLWGNSSGAPVAGGWGSAPVAPAAAAPAAGGWGAAPASASVPTPVNIKEIKENNGPIQFNFAPLKDDKALTEACAVANFLANAQQIETGADYLTLCFDVGGSTTDISVLCKMQEGLAMVKQNSIRFAAQRVASATKFSPNFKAVLLEVCERKNISIQGLNVKPEKYSAETASYFFEQIIDRLDESDFPSFYELLRSKCPEMLSINLYVTGLIMYYAGQLANKLRAEVSTSVEGAYLKTFNPAMGGDFKPIINIVFAGKGARIFDWFKSIDAQAANKYYTDLFIAGFGGMQIAQSLLFPGGYMGGPPIKINPTNEDGGKNLKYEVSKGLAYPPEKLLIPQNNEAIEILGEDGFKLVRAGQMQAMPYDSSITAEMMENIGTSFMSSPQPGQPACPKFMEFASIYYQTATGMFGLDIKQETFMQGFNSMNINSYIKNLPEYRTAVENKKSGKFDFVAPIIILEGMKFMEDIILKGIANK